MTKARTRLIQEVTANLEEAGFDVSTQCDVRPSCFDMAARRGDQLVLIKTLGNIDSFTQEDAMALQLVAQFFNAVPLIVGKKTRRESWTTESSTEDMGSQRLLHIAFRV